MTQPLAFCNYLRGILDANKASGISPSVGLSEAKTTLVKTKLNSVFLHVIDPSYPESIQPHLQQAHNGENTPDNTSGFPQHSTGHVPPREAGSGRDFIKC